MLYALLSFMAILAGSLFHTEAKGRINGSLFSKCDAAIITKIKATYNGPTNNELLEEIVSFKKLIYLSATSKFLQERVKCTSMIFSKDESHSSTKVDVHEELNGKGKTRDFSLELTVSGNTLVGEDSLIIYFVYSNTSVLACYPCIDSDKAAVGPPSGFVAASENNFTETDFYSALEAMACVGVRCTKSYPDTCP